MTTNRFLGVAAAGVACVVVSACSSSDPPGAAPVTSTRPASAGAATTASPAPGEDVVRGLAGGGTVDHYGWVEATAKEILATYYPPGSYNYIGGQHVALTDRIYVIKMHGAFDHSAPAGAKSTATLALRFYNVTTGEPIPFSQMWDGDAPDLGVGTDPGITDRADAAHRWDLRLIGAPTVRVP